MEPAELRRQILNNGGVFWALVGAVAGGLYGYVTTNPTDMIPPIVVAILGGGLGAAVGAGVGAIIGALWARYRHGL